MESMNPPFGSIPEADEFCDNTSLWRLLKTALFVRLAVSGSNSFCKESPHVSFVSRKIAIVCYEN
jgi:hypothetical protein